MGKIKLATIRAFDEPHGELIDIFYDPDANDEYNVLVTSSGEYLPATAESLDEAITVLIDLYRGWNFITWEEV